MHISSVDPLWINPKRFGKAERAVSSIPFCICRRHDAGMEQWFVRARRVMKEKRLSQEWLAERFEMTPGGMQKWLSGTRQPTVDEIEKIAGHLQISPAWLLLGLDEEGQLDGLPSWARERLSRLISATRAGQLDAEWFERLDLALQLVGLPPADAPSLISSPEVHARAKAQREHPTQKSTN